MTGPRLGPGLEFDVIRDVLRDRPTPSGAFRVPPGDDAAVLAHGATVVSTDLSVEDIHFRRSWLEASEVGYRAAAAALSDLAAMGARATAVLASLAGPPDSAASGYLAAVGRGVAEAAESVGAVLAGGDVTRSPGPVIVDVTVLGTVDRPWLRSGARAGHDLWVTGPLGAAGGAARLLEAGEDPPVALRRAFARPRPRLDVAEALRDGGVNAALDLSDGLLPDAGQLAAASGVGVTLAWKQIPVAPGLAERFGEKEARMLALTGGEDYELLLAAGADFGRVVEELPQELAATFTRVGRVEEGDGVRVVDAGGAAIPELGSSFRHFQEGP